MAIAAVLVGCGGSTPAKVTTPPQSTPVKVTTPSQSTPQTTSTQTGQAQTEAEEERKQKARLYKEFEKLKREAHPTGG
jgi:hypothetical protein